MTLTERYEAARKAAAAGDCAFALKEYEWYHDHALEFDPSLYGVRLSYALSDWAELGSGYEPAKQSLRAVFDRKVEALRNGADDWHLFHDVVAIGRHLDGARDTHELFMQLEKQNPEFASRCAELALDAIIQVGDFALARRCIGNIDERIATASARLQETIHVAAQRSEPGPDLRESFVRNYVARIKRMITVLRAVGERTEIERIRTVIDDAIQNPDIRNDVLLKLAEH